jgi:hypothetical protein
MLLQMFYAIAFHDSQNAAKVMRRNLSGDALLDHLYELAGEIDEERS